MLVPRSLHTATLLLDGRILVAGGTDSGPLASAEIYDPASDTWKATGALSQARYSHTAVLLPNGRVLIAGGRVTGANNAGLATAELYDPRTGIWTQTGLMYGARHSHTATLLTSGKVLVAGGDNQGGLSSAELFNPATGVWLPTGSLTSPRWEHTGTLLANGRVLAVGGSATNSADVYDPQMGTWAATNPTVFSHRMHIATRLPDGRVLVAAGMMIGSEEIFNPTTGAWTAAPSLLGMHQSPSATLLPNGKVLVASGSAMDPATEVFDPASPGWTAGPPLLMARRDHTATLLPNGRILFAGGSNSNGTLSSVEVFELASGGWSATAPIPVGRNGHTATLLPTGRVLVAGGYGTAETSDARLFHPVSGTWAPANPLPFTRYLHTATLLATGKVLIAGGVSGGVTTTAAVLYDPTSGSWAATGAMGAGRQQGHTATLLPNGKVLIAGGYSAGGNRRADLYDPESELWVQIASLGSGRVNHTATLLPDGRVLVAGGFGGGAFPLSSCELYDPASDGWIPTGSMNTPRRDHAAALLPGGNILVVGGSSNGSPLASAELFDPESEEWSQTGSLATARYSPRITSLWDGRLLVTGDGATSELYDPAAGIWSSAGTLARDRSSHSSTLLPDHRALVVGGDSSEAVVEVWQPSEADPSRRPAIATSPATLTFGTTAVITGSRFTADSPASDGGSRDSCVNYPLIHLFELERGRATWLAPDSPGLYWSDSTLAVSNLPAEVNPGIALLTVVAAGMPSASVVTRVVCNVAVPGQPSAQTVSLGGYATFAVATQGARLFQWQQSSNGSSFLDIPGATASTYTTPPASAADSGTFFRCALWGACTPPEAPIYSNSATLTISDTSPPSASVLAPSGGEYWLLSPASGPAHTKVITWSMADDIRVCQVDVSLWYSTDGGTSYTQAPPGGDLPATFPTPAPALPCIHPGETTTSLVYTVPTAPPSGSVGSLYKIELTVTDQAGLPTTIRSSNPFYIVQSNQDSVRTLILANTSRMQSVMGVSPAVAAALHTKLQELANHPRVQGLVVDLGAITDISALYSSWDGDSGSSDKANNVLFGCESPAQPGCGAVGVRNGVHDTVRQLLAAYGGTQHLVLVGDDRIIPLARLADRTVLFPESNYPSPEPGQDLTPTGTTVARALEANKFLSDDLAGVKDPITSDETSGYLYIPDLAVGRLVESPAEITTTIATFISQDGVLDLAALDPATGHKVLVTGYDFLSDSSRSVRARWKNALGVSTGDPSLAPVDGSLIGANWSLPTMPQRIAALRAHWGGNGGPRYGVGSLNGHATHYEEGVPAADQADTIQGLRSIDVYGSEPIACSPSTPSSGALALAGGVIYNVGCHGGLPVPGSCASDADHSLDLPQTMAARGIVGYVANTGYGWGLRHGIGYSERLAELATEELTAGGTVAFGEAVRQSKLRYFLESPQFDAYDEKCLMQWTYYGLPMYAVKTGTTPGVVAGGLQQDKTPDEESFGRVVVERTSPGEDALATLPPNLTQLTLRFDFSAPGVYTKKKSTGELETQSIGCSDPDGCYYTLNGLVERSTGGTDLPVQPYFIYDSRLSGTSQHGALWKGGTFKEESGWIPILAELTSNGGDGSNHGSTARVTRPIPLTPRHVPGLDPANCRPSDVELNSFVLIAGEAVKNQMADPSYTIERTYEAVDLELFYFNDTGAPTNNCDRSGPLLGIPPYAGKYHQTTDMRIDWGVPVGDTAGVWRVLVVVNDGRLDAQSRGAWVAQELTNDGTGTWRGSRSIVGTLRLTYVLQAIDNRGNVTWLQFSGTLPASGVTPLVADPVDAELADSDSDGMADDWESANGLLVGTNDAALDPDSDGLANIQEFQRGTTPSLQDTDGDGDNDGSEVAHSRNPLFAGDGRAIAIVVTRSGSDIVLSWTADAANSSGPYYVYRATSPFFASSSLRATLPLPAPATSYTDAGAVAGPSYYYWVSNVAIVATPAPSISLVLPNNGPQTGGNTISIYGDDFVPGSDVRIAGVACTTVVFVNPSKITCTVPAHAGAGSFDVRVTSPNGQYGTLVGGYSYNP